MGEFIKSLESVPANISEVDLRKKRLTKASGLTTLSLSGCLLKKLPFSLYSIKETEVLNLTENKLTEIDSELAELDKVKHLYLSDNELQKFPGVVKQLRLLEVLDISNNALGSFPDEILEIKTLISLYIGGNAIPSLPDGLSKLKKLQKLILPRNKLKSFPIILTKLKTLCHVDLGENRIKNGDQGPPLPFEILKMRRSLKYLNLKKNQLYGVPYLEVRKEDGTLDGFLAYVTELQEAGCKRQRLLLIGDSRAGKTSLSNALRHKKAKLAEEEDRTEVVEQYMWEPKLDIKVQINDFGGHRVYEITSRLFITDKVIVLVVFNLQQYILDPERKNYELLIGRWLRHVRSVAPEATVKVIGTHSDSLYPQTTQKIIEDVKESIKCDIRLEAEHIEELCEEMERPGSKENEERILELKKLLFSLPEENAVDVLSVSSKTLDGVEHLQTFIVDQCRRSGIQIPLRFHKFGMALKEDGAHTDLYLPMDRVLATYSHHDGSNFIKSFFRQFMPSSSYFASSPREAKEVLKVLNQIGYLNWYQEDNRMKDYVFHQPEKIVEIASPVFHYNPEEAIKKYTKAYRGRHDVYERHKQMFIDSGVMTETLLQSVINGCENNPELFTLVTALLNRFNFCFKFKTSEPAENEREGMNVQYYFPWLLQKEKPEGLHLREKWPLTPLPGEIHYEVQFRFQDVEHDEKVANHVRERTPSTFFEVATVELQRELMTIDQHPTIENWQDGLYAAVPDMKVLFTRYRDESKRRRVIQLSLRTQSTSTLWENLPRLHQKVKNVLSVEYPGCIFTSYVMCPHCIMDGNQENPDEIDGDIIGKKSKNKLRHFKRTKGKKDFPTLILQPPETDSGSDEQCAAVKEFLAKTASGIPNAVLDDMDACEHLDFLIQKKCLTVAAAQEIRDIAGTRMQNNYLLDCLSNVSTLAESLKNNSCQPWLAVMLKTGKEAPGPMTDCHRKAIINCWEELVRDLSPDPVFDVLYAKLTLTEFNKERIYKCVTRQEKVRELLKIILTRGDKAFAEFVDAVNEDCEWLAEKLREAAEKNA